MAQDFRQGDGLQWFAAKMELDVSLRPKHGLDCPAQDGLVIHEEHGDGVIDAERRDRIRPRRRVFPID